MYNPSAFKVDQPDEIINIIKAASLPVLVSTIAPPGQPPRLMATHLPLTLHENRLTGHFAKANEHWKYISPAVESLAMFTATDGYISPSWYAAKREHGKVVPTWNYETVHVYGRLEILTEPHEILPIVTGLTNKYEAGRQKPWAVSDAPDDYIAAQLKAIVGVVLHISRIEGKRKLSQNRSTADRQGVRDGLTAENTALAAAVAQTLEATAEATAGKKPANTVP